MFRKKATVAKQELFYVFPFGPAAYLCGVTFINRKNARASYETLNRMKSLLVNKKTKLQIYPEGTRNTSKIGFLPFKKGAFITAIQAQVEIIPAVIAPYYYDDERAGVFLHEKSKSLALWRWCLIVKTIFWFIVYFLLCVHNRILPIIFHLIFSVLLNNGIDKLHKVLCVCLSVLDFLWKF